MERDDFNIKMHDDVLRVSGEKRSPHTATEGRRHVAECAYGYFECIVPLPAPVLEEGAAAEYKRGVLRVTLQKDKQRQPRRLNVIEG